MKHILKYNDYLLKESTQTIQWTNTIDVFLYDFKDDERVKDKLISLIMKHILNKIYVENKADISENDRKAYNTLSSYDKVSFLCTRYKGIVNTNTYRELASIKDYLSENQTDINIVRSLKTFDELYDLSVEYHNNLDVTYKETRTDETEDTDVFITYPDGWYWINLNTDFSEDEKENMGHCGKDVGKILFSLRDDKNQSHITTSYNEHEKSLYQIKGRNNSKPTIKYHEKIIDMILNDKYPIKTMKTGSYRPDLDFSLHDISEERKNELYKLKPSLMLSDKMFVSYFKKKDYIGIISMVNNGYPGYKDYVIDLYHTTKDLTKFIADCSKLNIDYKKILNYCFSMRDASENGFADVVEQLINNGLDVSHNSGDISLIKSAEKGYTEIVDMLIDAGITPSIHNNQPVRSAMCNGHLETALFLIKHGADVNADDNSALRLAALHGYTKQVKFLIHNGADITVRDNVAIRTASENGHKEIVKMLIDAGADVNADDNDALYGAIGNGHLDIVRLLIDAGVDISSIVNKVLSHAILRGQPDILEFLINVSGVDFKTQNFDTLIPIIRKEINSSFNKKYDVYIDIWDIFKKHGVHINR